MHCTRDLAKVCAVAAIAFACASSGHAQALWRVDSRGASGVIAQLVLPETGIKTRTAFIVFEYARRCDPIFSFAEIAGGRLGRALSQSVLRDSSIGIILNGEFHTWHAAITHYENGYEAGFGVTNDLLFRLLVNLDSLEYVTPSGDRFRLPKTGFRESVLSALDYCRKRLS